MCLTMSRERKCGVFQNEYQFRNIKRNVDYMNTMSAHIFSYIHETCSSFLGTRKNRLVRAKYRKVNSRSLKTTTNYAHPAMMKCIG